LVFEFFKIVFVLATDILLSFLFRFEGILQLLESLGLLANLSAILIRLKASFEALYLLFLAQDANFNIRSFVFLVIKLKFA